MGPRSLDASDRGPTAPSPGVKALFARSAADVLHQSGASEGSVIGAIAATRSLSVIVEDTLKALVSQARAEGHTWAEIGDVLRVTRQAAFQRFGSTSLAAEPDRAGPPVADAVERTASLVTDLLAGRWDTVAKDSAAGNSAEHSAGSSAERKARRTPSWPRWSRFSSSPPPW